MLEIKEQKTLPFEENNQPLKEISKYHKRIDDLIEDAEIEAEIEAEKKIRSKNSRVFSISIIGIGLLGLVYFQINHQTAVAPVTPEKETQVKMTETTERSLARQVPMAEAGSNSSNIPTPQSSSPEKPIVDSDPFLTPSKTKNIFPETKSTKLTAKTRQTKTAPQVGKVSSRAKPKSNPKKTASVTKNERSRFYIQVGAFSVRKNAELLLKRLQDKGFSSSIKMHSQKLNQRIVTVGNFSNKKAGDGTLKDLTRNGFNTTYYKNHKNSFNLKVGQFKNLQDAQKMQDRLSVKGFLSESHNADVPVPTYMVQLGVFPSQEKARLTQEKLAQAGFPKTFLR